MNNIKKYLNNDLYKKTFAKSHELDKYTNFALEIYEEKKFASQNSNGKLNNVPFFIKDNVDFAGQNTTSASRTLDSHKSLITATILEKLLKAGAIPVGKTNMDEFGMGGTGLTSGYKPVYHPMDNKKIIGGSSAGSAAAVEAGLVPFSIGTDTGDSIRQPAAWCEKVVGMKPTYGIISRYGMHSFAPSLDTFGFFTTNVRDQAILLSISSGFDEKDFTSVPNKSYDFVTDLTPTTKGVKVGIFKTNKDVFSPEIQKKFNKIKDKLAKQGVEFVELYFDLQLLKVIYPTYQSIAFAEGFSQLSSINGLAFGAFDISKDIEKDIMQKRTEHFATLVKERIAIGSVSIAEQNQEKIFLQAKKIRRIIINKMHEIFKKCDVILSPTGGGPPEIKETSIHTSTKHGIPANYLQITNMTGGPSLVMPFTIAKDQTICIEIAGDIFQDQKVLNFSLAIENLVKGENSE